MNQIHPSPAPAGTIGENRYITDIERYSDAMIEHIERYTVGQYADYPHDNATGYTVADCLWQIRKYVSRFGSNRRPGQDRVDQLKIGHYCCIAAGKLIEPVIPDLPVLSYRSREWVAFFDRMMDVAPGIFLCTSDVVFEAMVMDQIRQHLDTLFAMEQTLAKKHQPDRLMEPLVSVAVLSAWLWANIPETPSAGQVRIKKMHPDAVAPRYHTAGSVGADLASVETVEIRPGETAMVRTGIAVEVPDGLEAQVRARSGISWAKELIFLNGVGTIDSDYRGEIHVPLKNIGESLQVIHARDRIAQLVIAPVVRATFAESSCLTETDRAGGGFGSTGV